MLAKLNRPDTPPKSTQLTKQQINNIMKSGPGTSSQAIIEAAKIEAKPKEAEKPKDYD